MNSTHGIFLEEASSMQLDQEETYIYVIENNPSTTVNPMHLIAAGLQAGLKLHEIATELSSYTAKNFFQKEYVSSKSHRTVITKSSKLCPTASAIAHAEEVSSYFVAKFSHLSFMSVPLTDYRRDVSKALTNWKNGVTFRQLPALAKLFDFYEEDVITDSVLASSESICFADEYIEHITDFSGTYNIIQQSTRSSKDSSYTSFWCKNAADSTVIMLCVDPTLPFALMITSQLTPGQTVEISGVAKIRQCAYNNKKYLQVFRAGTAIKEFKVINFNENFSHGA